MRKKYDAIIVGAGPAGLSCSITLSKLGKRCLVLERKKENKGKVCGDGITSRCLTALEYLDIDIQKLLDAGGKKIVYNITFYDDKTYKKKFRDDMGYRDFSIGVSRDVFDEILYLKAKEIGVDIVFDTLVNRIEYKSDKQIILNDDYETEIYINASGVLGVDERLRRNLPVGISSRIVGEGTLKDESFYFFRNSKYGDGYAWVFPVGHNIWNIGCWSLSNRREIKSLYEEFENEIRQKYIDYEHYERKPQGALLGVGNYSDRALSDNCIGDAALLVDQYSGEGIALAIESGINLAFRLVKKEPILFPNKTVVFLTEEGMEQYEYRTKREC